MGSYGQWGSSEGLQGEKGHNQFYFRLEILFLGIWTNRDGDILSLGFPRVPATLGGMNASVFALCFSLPISNTLRMRPQEVSLPVSRTEYNRKLLVLLQGVCFDWDMNLSLY